MLQRQEILASNRRVGKIASARGDQAEAVQSQRPGAVFAEEVVKTAEKFGSANHRLQPSLPFNFSVSFWRQKLGYRHSAERNQEVLINEYLINFYEEQRKRS